MIHAVQSQTGLWPEEVSVAGPAERQGYRGSCPARSVLPFGETLPEQEARTEMERLYPDRIPCGLIQPRLAPTCPGTSQFNEPTNAFSLATASLSWVSATGS